MNNGTFGLPRNAKLPSHFSQDGGIARPWLEKAREGFKSVKDFGAQGAGRDETRQIQAALDAAKRASVPLFIPSGFYSVSNASGPALNISYTDLTQEPATERKRVDILGEGVGASVIRPASSAQFGLKITGGPGIQASHYWQVSRLSFGAGVLGARGLHVFDAAFSKISDVGFYGLDEGLRLESVLTSMAKERGKISNTGRARGAARLKRKSRRRSPSSAAFSEVEHLTNQVCGAAEQLVERIIDLEAVLDFYAWGTNPKGELEPMRGEEYAKAMAKDGGRLARTRLKDRFDGEYFGAPNKKAPDGWGVRPVEKEAA